MWLCRSGKNIVVAGSMYNARGRRAVEVGDLGQQMETRKFNAIVGAAVLVLAAIVLVALFVAVRADFKKDYTYYNIYFDRPISGLAKAGEVRFSGLLVGEVRKIAMDQRKPGRVVVTIRVYSSTPVTTDTLATLESMGFTGVAFMQLLTDDQDNKPGVPLVIADDEEYAVIRSRTAAQGTMRSAAEILASTMRTLDAAARYMSDENIAGISATLDAIQATSGDYVKKSGGYKQAILKARDDMAELNRFTAAWEVTSSETLPAKIAGLRETAKNLEELSNDLDVAVTEKRASFSGLSSGKLPELNTFATELRRAAASFNRTLERIEDDRVEMLFKPDPPEVEIPKP